MVESPNEWAEHRALLWALLLGFIIGLVVGHYL